MIRALLRVLLVVSAVCLIALLAGGAAWWARGGRIMSVQTGSMAPTVRPGDGLVILPASFNQLKSGDVVSYHSGQDPNVVISHRIVSVNRAHGTIITRGDNLSQPDSTVYRHQIIGRAIAVAPQYGRAAQALRTPQGLAVGLYLPALVFVAIELWLYASGESAQVYRFER